MHERQHLQCNSTLTFIAGTKIDDVLQENRIANQCQPRVNAIRLSQQQHVVQKNRPSLEERERNEYLQ